MLLIASKVLQLIDRRCTSPAACGQAWNRGITLQPSE